MVTVTRFELSHRMAADVELVYESVRTVHELLSRLFGEEVRNDEVARGQGGGGVREQ